MVAVQEREKYGRTSGTSFGPVDPVRYADQIRSVMKRALDTPGPVIIGVHVDYRDNYKLFENVNTRAVLDLK